MAQDPDGGFRVTDRRRRDHGVPAAPETAGRRTPPAADAASGGLPTEGRSLDGLFMMLASSAVVALGDAPDPATGGRRADLSGASEIIEVLLLLREKTEGNRTADETRLLDELLYDLQLRYVRATKSAG